MNWVITPGEQGRGDIGGAMTWPGAHGEIFRELLAHPTSTSALLEVFDDGFRLDHMYGILMTDGTEGHTMHGGGHTERPGAFYRYRDGQMRCGLTVAGWQLTDQMAGDGGFAVVPGSECRLCCLCCVRAIPPSDLPHARQSTPLI